MRPLPLEEFYDEADNVPALAFLATLPLLGDEERECGVVILWRGLLLSVPIWRDLVSLPISYTVSFSVPVTCNIFINFYTAYYIVVETLCLALSYSNSFFLPKRVADEKTSWTIIPLELSLERESKIFSFVWKSEKLTMKCLHFPIEKEASRWTHSIHSCLIYSLTEFDNLFKTLAFVWAQLSDRESSKPWKVRLFRLYLSSIASRRNANIWFSLITLEITCWVVNCCLWVLSQLVTLASTVSSLLGMSVTFLSIDDWFLLISCTLLMTSVWP